MTPVILAIVIYIVIIHGQYGNHYESLLSIANQILTGIPHKNGTILTMKITTHNHENNHSQSWTGWWFGTFFPYIGNVIIPTDFHIFQRGGSTTNQLITMCNHVYPQPVAKWVSSTSRHAT